MFIRNLLRLLNAYKNVVNYSNTNIIAYPATKPSLLAIIVSAWFNIRNPNNIGNHTIRVAETGFNGTQELEKEVIYDFVKTVSARNPTHFNGYITAGGTEGNIMGLWIARNLFCQNKTSNNGFRIITTALTHYSVVKATHLLGLNGKVVVSNLNQELRMDLATLEKLIRSLISEGIMKFAIVCTVGYTVSGTSDDIFSVHNLLETLSQDFSGVKFFIHVDACHGYFFDVLNDEKYRSLLDLKYVNSISIDPHKFGYIQYSCALFICKKEFFKLIRTKVPYIYGHFDDTLLGSRSGAIAAGLWAMIKFKGFPWYLQQSQRHIKLTSYFIRQIHSTSKNIQLFHNNLSNIVAVSFEQVIEGGRLPKKTEHTYGLNATEVRLNRRKKYTLYKFVFSKHSKKVVIDQFIHDIRQIL